MRRFHKPSIYTGCEFSIFFSFARICNAELLGTFKLSMFCTDVFGCAMLLTNQLGFPVQAHIGYSSLQGYGEVLGN